MSTALPIIREIPWHPCMNEQAHHQVARLHLPVAPRCNLHCIYCHRGIAKINRSTTGPGLAAGILTPAEALATTRRYLQRWGTEAIVGIAGPGDPLANRSTLLTLKLLRAAFPDIRLCLCTNGLCLLDHLDLLMDLGLEHLSVTVNGIDPEIVRRIQPWILYDGKEFTGITAATLLIVKQLKGIRQATDGGMFIKVNTVVLPGINDHHVMEIAHEVKNCGAGLINLIPWLQPDQNGILVPSANYNLTTLQQQTAQVLPVFTKCKQCRADAEGIPGKEKCYVG